MGKIAAFYFVLFVVIEGHATNNRISVTAGLPEIIGIKYERRMGRFEPGVNLSVLPRGDSNWLLGAMGSKSGRKEDLLFLPIIYAGYALPRDRRISSKMELLVSYLYNLGNWKEVEGAPRDYDYHSSSVREDLIVYGTRMTLSWEMGKLVIGGSFGIAVKQIIQRRERKETDYDIFFDGVLPLFSINVGTAF